jgi:hypothetical protein
MTSARTLTRRACRRWREPPAEARRGPWQGRGGWQEQVEGLGCESCLAKWCELAENECACVVAMLVAVDSALAADRLLVCLDVLMAHEAAASAWPKSRSTARIPVAEGTGRLGSCLAWSAAARLACARFAGRPSVRIRGCQPCESGRSRSAGHMKLVMHTMSEAILGYPPALVLQQSDAGSAAHTQILVAAL